MFKAALYPYSLGDSWRAALTFSPRIHGTLSPSGIDDDFTPFDGRWGLDFNIFTATERVHVYSNETGCAIASRTRIGQSHYEGWVGQA